MDLSRDCIIQKIPLAFISNIAKETEFLSHCPSEVYGLSSGQG